MLLYPQPVALSCGRIFRARTEHERLDAIVRSAEVLTRYVVALSVSSFCAREEQEYAVPSALESLEGNLSFGDFLSVAKAVASVDVDHPLKNHLGPALKGKKGEPGPANLALTSLLNLRNEEGTAVGHSRVSL